MRVRTYMRRIRTAKHLTLTDAAASVGVARGTLSNIERGVMFPKDYELPGLVGLYGHPSGWYQPGVYRLLLDDLQDCPGCGDELDPESSRARRYHGDECRQAAWNDKRRKPRPAVRDDILPPHEITYHVVPGRQREEAEVES